MHHHTRSPGCGRYHLTATQRDQSGAPFPVTGDILHDLPGNLAVIRCMTPSGFRAVIVDLDECEITAERTH